MRVDLRGAGRPLRERGSHQFWQQRKREGQTLLAGRQHCASCSVDPHETAPLLTTLHLSMPCRSPALIGCFIVDRQYFQEIGLLDEGMEVYGGENVELGIRVSRVSHQEDFAQLPSG